MAEYNNLELLEVGDYIRQQFYEYNGEYFYYVSGKTFYYKKNLDETFSSIIFNSTSYSSNSSVVVWDGENFVVGHSNSGETCFYKINDSSGTMKVVASTSSSTYKKLSISRGITDSNGYTYFVANGNSSYIQYLVKISGSITAAYIEQSAGSSGSFIFEKDDFIYWGSHVSSTIKLYKSEKTLTSAHGTTTDLSSTTNNAICDYAGEYWVKSAGTISINTDTIYIGKGNNFEDITDWTTISLSSFGLDKDFLGFNTGLRSITGRFLEYIEELNLYIIKINNDAVMYTNTPEDLTSWKFIELPKYSTDLSSSAKITYSAPYLYVPRNLIIPMVLKPEPEGPILGLELSGMTTTYYVGEEIVFDGVVEGIWSNGKIRIKSGYVVSAPNMSKPGIKSVTVTYTDENNITASTTYKIKVIEASLFDAGNIESYYGTFIGKKRLIKTAQNNYSTQSKGLYTYDLSDPSKEPLISFPDDTFFTLENQIYQYKEFIFAFKYTSSTSQSIVYSDDYGTTWKEGYAVASLKPASSSQTPLDFLSRFFEVNGNLFFYHKSQNDNYFYIYKFDYDSSSWSQVFGNSYSYIGKTSPGIASDGLNAIITLSCNSSSYYARVLYTKDGGDTWNISPNISGTSSFTQSDVISIKGNTNIVKFTKGSNVTTSGNMKYFKSTDGGASYSAISPNITILETSLPIIDNGNEYSSFIFINNINISTSIAIIYRYPYIRIPEQTLRTSSDGATWSPTAVSTYGIPKLIGKWKGKYVGIYKENETTPAKITLSSDPITNEDIRYIDIDGDAYYNKAKFSKETGSILLYDASNNMQIIELEGEDSSSTVSTSVISYFIGSEFIPTNPYYYNGSEFVLCDAYRHNGTEFVKIE